MVTRSDFDAPYLAGAQGIVRHVDMRAKSCTTEFDSWERFVAHAENDAPQLENGSSVTGSADFTETKDWESALTLARNGWAEKRGDIADLRDRVKADPVVGSLFDDFQMYPGTVHNVAGAFPDVAAFLAGDPECMVEFAEVEEPRSGRVVRLLIDGAYSCGTDTETVIKRGAVVVALVELLEALGFSTEVWTEIGVKSFDYGKGREGGTWHFASLVRVKSADSPLAIDSLMFAIAHPSTLRRLAFRSWECENQPVRAKFGIGSGYGMPTKPRSGERIDAHVVLNAANRNNPETLRPETWIREIVTGLFTE